MTHDPARRDARHEHMPLGEHEANRVEMIELSRLRRRSGLERGVRLGTAVLGVVLGVALLVVSVPRGAPLGIVLGLVAILFGVLNARGR